MTHQHEQPFHFKDRYFDSWILDDTHLHSGNNRDIALAVANGTLIGVSDGSHIKERQLGTAGWVFEDSTQSHQAYGKAAVPGPPCSQCSYRSELLGLLGMITHILHICRRYNIATGNVSLFSDSEGAINFLSYPIEYVKTSTNHFDVLTSIVTAMRQTNIVWKFTHVKGHQDDDEDIENLPREAQLNVLADNLAKEKMTECINMPDTSTLYQRDLPYSNITVSWKDHRKQSHQLYSNLIKTLHDHIHTSQIKQYWCSKSKYTMPLESSIDWSARSKSHSNMSKATNRWVCKWLTGFCGVEAMLVLYKHQKHSKCPRCNADDESVTHVLQCPDARACQLWNEEIDALHTWIIDNKGCPELAHAVTTYLQAWHSGNGFPSNDYSEILQNAIREQNRIGWQSFIEGFWSVRWREHQHQYLLSIKSKRSSILWISKLQRRIWRIPWKMWEQRNTILHSNGTIHQYETELLKQEIRDEWTNHNQFPYQCRNLFRGTLEQRLQTSIQQQKRWIINVWAAQEKLGIERNNRDEHILNIFTRWKKSCT